MNIHTLPSEIIHQILSHLSLYELLLCSRVSKYYQSVALNQLLFKNVTLNVSSSNTFAFIVNDNQSNNVSTLSTLSSCQCLKSSNQLNSHSSNVNTFNQLTTLPFKPLTTFPLNSTFLKRLKPSLRSIKSLNVINGLLPNHLVSLLDYLPHLQEIRIPNCDFSTQLLKAIIHTYSKNIKVLDISNNRMVNDELIRTIAIKCTLLNTLNVSKCMNLTIHSITFLIESRSSTLKNLTLQKMYSLTEDDLHFLFNPIKNTQKLKYLDLSNNHHMVYASVLNDAFRFIPNREFHINLRDCEQLVRKTVENLELSYPLVKISHNTMLYDYSIESVKNYLDLMLSS